MPSKSWLSRKASSASSPMRSRKAAYCRSEEFHAEVDRFARRDLGLRLQRHAVEELVVEEGEFRVFADAEQEGRVLPGQITRPAFGARRRGVPFAAQVLEHSQHVALVLRAGPRRDVFKCRAHHVQAPIGKAALPGRVT